MAVVAVAVVAVAVVELPVTAAVVTVPGTVGTARLDEGLPEAPPVCTPGAVVTVTAGSEGPPGLEVVVDDARQHDVVDGSKGVDELVEAAGGRGIVDAAPLRLVVLVVAAAPGSVFGKLDELTLVLVLLAAVGPGVVVVAAPDGVVVVVFTAVTVVSGIVVVVVGAVVVVGVGTVVVVVDVVVVVEGTVVVVVEVVVVDVVVVDVVLEDVVLEEVVLEDVVVDVVVLELGVVVDVVVLELGVVVDVVVLELGVVVDVVVLELGVVVDVVVVEVAGRVAGPGSGVSPLETKLLALQLDGSSPIQMEHGSFASHFTVEPMSNPFGLELWGSSTSGVVETLPVGNTHRSIVTVTLPSELGVTVILLPTSVVCSVSPSQSSWVVGSTLHSSHSTGWPASKTLLAPIEIVITPASPS